MKLVEQTQTRMPAAVRITSVRKTDISLSRAGKDTSVRWKYAGSTKDKMVTVKQPRREMT
jgi:hypothetical protein